MSMITRRGSLAAFPSPTPPPSPLSESAAVPGFADIVRVDSRPSTPAAPPPSPVADTFDLVSRPGTPELIRFKPI